MLEWVNQNPDESESKTKERKMANELFQKMAQSIIDGDSDVAVELAKQAIAQGINPDRKSVV